MELCGYVDRLSVCPGEELSVMVSASCDRFRARLVRLIHGDENPDGPGYKAIPIPSEIEGSYEGVEQPLVRGSHLAVERLACPPAFTIAVWVWPSLLGEGERGLLGHAATDAGMAMTLDEDGRLGFWLGGEEVARTSAVARRRRWHLATATYDPVEGVAVAGLGPLGGEMAFAERPLAVAPDGIAGVELPFWVGAWPGAGHFNGKLEDPAVFQAALLPEECELLLTDAKRPEQVGSILARWDFSQTPSSREVPDVAGRGHDGRLVNRPMRAVTGRRWRGVEIDFRQAPEEYGAVHFHDDDLDDAGWAPSLSWSVPDELGSGVYGIELSGDRDEDVIPVFVRPRRGTATAPIALLAPTFSYLAYGNAHVMSNDEAREYFRREEGHEIDYPARSEDVSILAGKLHSLYDHHSDGSGVCYSSWLRPLLSMRPKYCEPELSGGRGAPHQFAADLHLVDWLYEQGYDVDVITDHDLHEEGAELLDPYRVVLTGSHPEYVSERILDALAAYLAGGGRVMYLGGNGFYWVTELDPEDRHTVEVRRWGASTRFWEALPGEWYLDSTGTPGGLWRFRGRAPQRLFGTGFTAQGLGSNRPYDRAPASYEEPFRFVFEGLGERERICDQPALVNEWGAAGFEIDRFDPELGSPEGTVVLATASAFGDNYQHVVDEVLVADSRQGGSECPLVRADMVLTPHPNGGAVFSPGSITWCSCLSHNGYDNDASRITANVLERFLDGDVFAPRNKSDDRGPNSTTRTPSSRRVGSALTR